mmetsp:Transcript_25628/g.39329  ORF Transcript_25628/g.39329 Transcript_25628/m.39329 type:complete len:122 (+) Transcript_25628:156-521(+)
MNATQKAISSVVIRRLSSAASKRQFEGCLKASQLYNVVNPQKSPYVEENDQLHLNLGAKPRKTRCNYATLDNLHDDLHHHHGQQQQQHHHLGFDGQHRMQKYDNTPTHAIKEEGLTARNAQ